MPLQLRPRNNQSSEKLESRAENYKEDKPKADKSKSDKYFDEKVWLDQCNKNARPPMFLVVEIFDAPQSYWNHLNVDSDSKVKATGDQAKRVLYDWEAVNEIRDEYLRRGNYLIFFQEREKWPAGRIIDILHQRIRAPRG
jgi:hypothetical protein